MIRIAELEFDDYNEEKLAEHGIHPAEVMQLLDNPFTVRRNKKAQTGDRQLIGRTHGGRALTVILAATLVPGRWRPITGWESTPAERRALDD
jgi:uncharacterized DUF497 family protein